MQISNDELINELVVRIKQDMNSAEELLQLSVEQLNQRPGLEAWSALECIEHLNHYGDFYIPEISNRLKGATQVESSTQFYSGWLGDYFAKSMLPKQKLNKMSTFKSMNPLGSDIDQSVLEKFILQQKQMLNLLAQCRTVDLKRIKTSISISKIIKLRLGDTLRVVIYHNNRHLIQAQRAAGIGTED